MGERSVNGKAWVPTTRQALLAWYDRHKRDLPWRRTRDPYAIWISETMLQQTRVETVIPYWTRFLARFPDVQALADAEQNAVYEEWTGLGYYSRARNLQAAARQIVDEHGGQLPDEAETLLTLKGIGPYTAGAVASIAFDRPAAIVDGNVIRVLARLRGIRTDVARKEVKARLWEEAGLLADGPRPGDLNQAMMELGATICLPKAPLCLTCPLRSGCDAARVGDASELPIKQKKKAARKVSAVAVWIERRGQVLAVQRPEQGLMANLWELPGGDCERPSASRADIEGMIRDRVGLVIGSLDEAGSVTHLFTHRRMRVAVYRAGEIAGRVRLAGYQAFRWMPAAKLQTLPQAGPMRKALALLGEGPEESPRARIRGHQAGASR